MTPRAITRLQFESLEGRALMSAAAIAAPIMPAPLIESVVMPNGLRHALTGQIKGTYTVGSSVANVGSVTTLSGSGSLGRLGTVTVSGTFTGPGNVPQGRARGTLTLSNANGTVTLALLGPVQKGSAALPQTFQYSIVSATGQYVALRDRGMIQFNLQPTSSSTGGFTLSI